MANDDQRRKAFWDEEEEESDSPVRPGSKPQTAGAPKAIDAEAVDQKIHDTKVLMEQTHQLYQHYFNGVEKRPPAEKARFLEARIKEIERMNPPGTATRFKLSQFLAQYNTFKELWEKKLRERERK